MLKGLLVLVDDIVVTGLKSIDIQAHIADHMIRFRQTSLGVDDGMAALGSLDEFGVLLLEDGEVLLCFPVPDAVGGEEEVHFFQGALVGLRVEAVDHGQGDDVGDAEDVVSLLLEGLEDDGQDECEPAVANGPANNTPGVALGADLERENLGGVEPWYCEPGRTEGCCEEEDHSHGARRISASHGRAYFVLETEGGETTSEEHGDTLDDGAPVEGPATTNSVESEDTNECGKLNIISKDANSCRFENGLPCM